MDISLRLHITSAGIMLPPSNLKMRASRAGTRNVGALSPAQLARKRAHDRETQRAKRQRSKDHINGLQRTIVDLQQSNHNIEVVASSARNRIQELEEENYNLQLQLGRRVLATNLDLACMLISGRKQTNFRGSMGGTRSLAIYTECSRR